MNATERLERSVERATGFRPAAVRFPNEEAARAGVRYRRIAQAGSRTIDGSAPAAVVFFEVECRAPEPFGGRRMVDDIIADLGDFCSHAMARQDHADTGGRAGRSLKTQRTYAHLAHLGIAA